MAQRSPRKLAVILHADVAGSTRLVQLDETLAHERIQATFRRFSGTIHRYEGITHELRGDALVAEFARASDALSAALAFQAANRAHNQELPDDIRPEVRVGISLGEVVIADGTVTGAGVILAQRLEQLAEPGRVVVQGSVAETVPGRFPFLYESLGEQVLKGFEQPVRAFRVGLEPGRSSPEPASGSLQPSQGRDRGPTATRRLAAIMSAGVAGYSRLVGADEAGTRATLKRHRVELIDPKVKQYGGRVAGTDGEGLLVEFGSIIDAVQCAVEVQQVMDERNAEVPADRRLELRVGVSLGDVLVDGDDIHGDGVNVAGRLEQLATPGGVCIAGTVREHTVGKLPYAFDDAGEQSVESIVRPVRVFRLRRERLAVSAPAPALANAEDLPLPSKPSVAVLPFTNMSGDPEQEYFSSGITEDIITELSRNGSLFVIARNSSFQFKGGGVDVAEVGRKLGVRYVVEGSVRKAGKRIRITAQLVEAASGNHVWAERYDRDLEDIFAVQDEVTERIVWALAGRVEMAETARSKRRPMESLDAYDLVLRGAELVHRYSRESNAEALRLFERAVELEPASGTALTGLARTYFYASAVESDESKRELARQAAERALAEGDPDGQAEGVIGYITGLRGDFDGAQVHIDRAVARGPHNPHNLVVKGYLLLWQGRAADALKMGERLWRLDPLDPPIVHELLAFAHYLLGNYQESLEAFRRWGLMEYHRGYANLAACLAQLGRIEEARAAWHRCLELKPGFNLEAYERGSPYRRPEDLGYWLDGLRKAGICE